MGSAELTDMEGRSYLLGHFGLGRKCLDHLLFLMPHLLILSPHLFKLSKKVIEKFSKHKLLLTATDVTPTPCLPNDIMINVFTRLQVTSLCQIRCASKAYLNLVDSSIFGTLYTQRLLNEVPVPHLMLLAWSPVFENVIAFQPLKYCNDGRLTKIYKHCDTLMPIKMFSNALVYQVVFVYCNLFCVSHRIGDGYIGSCYLVDPLRGEVLKLPTSTHDDTRMRWFGMRWYGMGFDNVTSTHKIVCVFTPFGNDHSHMEAFVYTLGKGGSWRKIQSIPPCNFFLSRCKNISAYGDMHWLVDVVGENNSYLISFDFKKDEFVQIAQPNITRFHFENIHLVTLKGRLALVHRSLHGERDVEIWVLVNYYDDDDEREWLLEHKIDHAKMFGGPVIDCGEWEHGIFFKGWGGGMDGYIFYFWDARYNSMNMIKDSSLFPSIFSCEFWSGESQPAVTIFSYTRSLISLKNYGNLVEKRVGRRSSISQTSDKWVSLIRAILRLGGFELTAGSHLIYRPFTTYIDLDLDVDL